MNALYEIEEILSTIEELDRASDGQFRQASDREAFDLVCRIERKMLQQGGKRAAG